MLAAHLSRLAKEFTYERAKPFVGSKFGDFVRHDLAQEAKRSISFWPFDLIVRASVGQGMWASVPWLAFFDPLETDTATRGCYVVFLINPDTNEITLSMNQGTTEVLEEFGRKRGFDVLRRRAKDIADRIPEFAAKFDEKPINLGSDAALPLGYEAGHAFGRTYHADSLLESDLLADLEAILFAYEALINRGGITPTEVMQSQTQGAKIEETRRYVLSQRIERTPKVRKFVLQHCAPVCQGCGLDPALDYSYSGPTDRTPLDVHHAVPLNHLAEGETRRYRVPDDFLVLCPTCHRIIHTLEDPSDLDALRTKIKFKFAREVSPFRR